MIYSKSKDTLCNKNRTLKLIDQETSTGTYLQWNQDIKGKNHSARSCMGTVLLITSTRSTNIYAIKENYTLI